MKKYEKEDLKKAVSIIGIIMLFIIGGVYRIQKNKTNYDNVVEENIIIEKVEDEKEKIVEETKIKVYVAGEVVNPGIVELGEDSRICDAIEKVGGVTENANLTQINLAGFLEDGQKLYIPNENEIKDITVVEQNEGVASVVNDEGSNSNLKININKASEEKLQEIPGVGPSMAQKIVSYRKENGKFNSIEELKNVKGIGDKKFEKMKEYISIK